MSDADSITSGLSPSPRICLLAEAPFAIPVLSRWFVEEWTPWYGPSGNGDATADLRACCHRDRLPLAVVALDENDQILGTAALKNESLGSELGYGPWLAAVLVGASVRRQGIGNALVGAIEDQARRLGVKRLYVSTDSAAALLIRRGWVFTGEQVTSLRGDVSILYRDLETVGMDQRAGMCDAGG